MRFATGSVLYNAGDAGDSVFTVRKGVVKLTQYLEEGTHRIVRLLRTGAATGLEALLDRDFEHTATTLQPALVCRIPVAVIRRLDVSDPDLHLRIRERWHTSLHDADEWILALSTGTGRARMARLLLLLSDEDDNECDLFNREDMGAILGLTTETASRTIAEFKRIGAVTEIGPYLGYCDREMLEEIAREESNHRFDNKHHRRNIQIGNGHARGRAARRKTMAKDLK